MMMLKFDPLRFIADHAGMALAEAIAEAYKQGQQDAQPELPIKKKCTICPHCDNCDVNDDGTIAQPEPCDDPRADVYYLAEKIGIHRLYALVVELRGEPEPCEDAVSRQGAIDAVSRGCQEFRGIFAECEKNLNELPPAQPEKRTGERTETHACDSISRQAAIDEIEYELEMINSVLDSITLDFNAREKLRQRRGEAREILNSIQQLPSAQPEQRWIPVTERLPEEPYGCLVTVWDSTPTGEGDDFENILPYFVGWDGEQWNDGNGEQCPFEVIAWVPLPEPYKDDPCNGCDYLGESCVGEGCGKLTEREEGEAE